MDVAIIGGGPAGAAAARLLAGWGRSLLLLTRAPVQDALAESLPPSCVKLFDRIGVHDAVDGAGFLRATGNTVNWGAGGERVEHFAEGALGYQVERDAFDALLIRSARSAGATVEENAIVRRVERAADCWTVTYDSPDETKSVNAECVLDCSGRTGVVARDGWRLASTGARTMAIVRVWERDDDWRRLVPDETHTLVESYGGGWAWSVPVSERRRFITVMVDPELTTLPGRQHLADAYSRELARTERLSALIADGATPVTEPWARDASPYTAGRFGEAGLLLVGDAGSFIDPLSSFGVKKALASAWLAAVVANTWCLDPLAGDAALDLFNRRERAMYRHLQLQAASLASAAADAHASDFWTGRADAEMEGAPDGEVDIEAMRSDTRVLSAFDSLKQRRSVCLRQAPGLRIEPRAVVRGDRVVLEDHLVTSALGSGVRYARNVDLLLLSDVAGMHDHVPDMFDAYSRRTTPVPLPDFLGALSTLIALDLLTFA